MSWHRNTHLWIFDYIHHAVRRTLRSGTQKDTIHVMFCVVDHFEPFAGQVSFKRALERVERWCDELPRSVGKHEDSDGKNYRHTFFYPLEEYNEKIVQLIADLCHQGFGEFEIHLHHDSDDSDNLRKTLIDFKNLLFDRHAVLSVDKESKEIKYGFIHGNWALDNSRPDGCWCGVNDELKILGETGCFADFTMPSAPDITQTSKINSIYYAVDDPMRPKSHNSGHDLETGKEEKGDILLVQGPLALDWASRKKGFLPGIENGELGGGRSPNMRRFKLWFNQRIHVKGKQDWIFIKVHTHGAVEKNAEVLLGDKMNCFLSKLEDSFLSSGKLRLHYVTAREMFNIIKAAESGFEGEPNDFRDHRLVLPHKHNNRMTVCPIR